MLLLRHDGSSGADTDRKQPVALRRTWDECRCNFRSSCACGEVSHPEWGMITALVSTARASWMMGIFRASHEDRFHRTPEEDSRDQAGVRTIPELTPPPDPPTHTHTHTHTASPDLEAITPPLTLALMHVYAHTNMFLCLHRICAQVFPPYVFSLHTPAQVITASLSAPLVGRDKFCVSELSVCAPTRRLNDFQTAAELQLSGTVTSAKRVECVCCVGCTLHTANTHWLLGKLSSPLGVCKPGS